MTKNLEIEFKNKLTEAEMKQLTRFFSVKVEDYFWQENIYFDSSNLTLKARFYALRVRIKNNSYEFTLKEPVTNGILETNQMISLNELNQLYDHQIIPSGAIKDRLSELLGSAPVSEIARMTTKRVVLPYQGQEIFLDESSYYNQIDYELELETDDYDEGKQVFDALLNQFSIQRKVSPSKSQRAFAYKKSMI